MAARALPETARLLLRAWRLVLDLWSFCLSRGPALAIPGTAAGICRGM